MHKPYTLKTWKIFAGLLFSLGILLTPELRCFAKTCYVNPDTGYRTEIEDDAELLTEEEITLLASEMEKITEYGNAAFKTISSNSVSAKNYAGKYYGEIFGTSSGTLFLIDMDNRQIWIHSDGAVYKVITSSYADSITDNVYWDASIGDYYTCASEAFAQIHTLLTGNRIMQPMKYISNGLLALILALLINFGYICVFSRLSKPQEKELMKKIHRRFYATPPSATYTHQTTTYSPISSDSDSGSSDGGSSDGGSSSSGGSSSGGGGGHSF